MFRLLHTNVLDATADALLLTIDGQARGLRGNIAHAFQHRWPNEYDDFEAQLRFPIPLGSAVRIDADTVSPWRTILFVATLHHLETLDDETRLDVIRHGLGSALQVAAATGLRTLATTPMKGGWRLGVTDAYRTMDETWRASALHRTGGTLLVCCRDPSEYQALVNEHRHLFAR